MPDALKTSTTFPLPVPRPPKKITQYLCNMLQALIEKLPDKNRDTQAAQVIGARCLAKLDTTTPLHKDSFSSKLRGRGWRLTHGKVRATLPRKRVFSCDRRRSQSWGSSCWCCPMSRGRAMAKSSVMSLASLAKPQLSQACHLCRCWNDMDGVLSRAMGRVSYQAAVSSAEVGVPP